ncbi:MAG: phosphoglucosamine mutase [Firmicutes bacterium]|jgi:phosphoglucosamine mutase|nr:phosphoglucosamine mutase [Bacillota bacterium]
MARLFGTDGVREIANAFLSPELAFALGRVGAGIIARRLGKAPTVVVGRDTRLSGDMLEAAVTAGIASVGGHAVNIGVIPTPGVAFLVRDLPADAGIIISASHNPMEYNGIKFISGDGFKLSDEEELEIEKHIAPREGGMLSFDAYDDLPRPVGNSVGRVSRLPDAGERYLMHAKSTVDVGLEGLKVVVDCANGAASLYTPRLLRDLGVYVTAINDMPDGTNINARCGSTHPQALSEIVIETGADLGLAHDGDADRLIAVDEKGNLVDGDHIMAICGLDLLRRGMLPRNTIVATVYSNLGLSKTFAREGGNVVITQNGDRYVLEEMRRLDVVLGGEQSGHIIFLDRNTTGDGIITALALMSVLRRTGGKLSELASWMDVYPQVLVNVNVTDKQGLFSNSAINRVIERAQALMSKDGRIFVRPSGTESLVRILGEGPDESLVRAVVSDIARVIQEELG